jgi:NAD(P)-dependent dehydrogenase (short-subunit alcohol dehydrogenase family)
LKKKVLIVGAGSGIGEALLNNLSTKENIEVVGISRKGNSSKSSLVSGKNYHIDLSSKEIDLDFLFQWEKLDAIYFTMGNGLFKPIHELKHSEIEYHFKLNLIAPFIVIQKIFPLISKGIKPFVCFLSSTAGKIGFPESTAYCASKHGIAGLAKGLREEWKSLGIRVFTIYPGAIYTDIWKDRDEFDPKDMISVEAFSDFLSQLINLDPMINIDDLTILPPKGIL